MIRAAALAAVFLLCGCPESVGQQCPLKTGLVGQFALSFTGQHDAGECVETLADGGTVRLTLDAGTPQSGALCFGAGSDGGPEVTLVVPGKTARSSDLLPDGGFHFVGNNPPIPGVCNGCLVGFDESFDGFLQTGAPFTLQGDGGLPPVSGLAGSLIDQLSSPTGGCDCNVPCTVTYAVAGKPL